MSTDTEQVFGASGWWEEDGSHRLLHAVNPKRLAYVIERTGTLAGKNVLDVGCGGGIFSLALAQAGATVTGIDVSHSALATATAEAKKQALPVEFHCYDTSAYLASKHKQEYALVVCMEMLEHVADPQAEINALAKLVVPGGDLIIATINKTLAAKAAMIWGLENFLNVLPTGAHSYDKFLPPTTVANWCREAGLNVVDIAGLNWSFFGKTFLLSRTQMPVNYFVHACKD